MNLFIVVGGWNYEGEEVIGVYDSESVANEVADAAYAAGGYEYVDIRLAFLNQKIEN